MNEATLDLIKNRVIQLDADIRWIENKIDEQKASLESLEEQRKGFKAKRADFLETLMEVGVDYDPVQS